MAWKPLIKWKNRHAVEEFLRAKGLTCGFGLVDLSARDAEKRLARAGISESHRIGCSVHVVGATARQIGERPTGRFEMFKLMRVQNGWMLVGGKSGDGEIEQLTRDIILTPGARTAAIAHAAKQFVGTSGKLPQIVIDL